MTKREALVAVFALLLALPGAAALWMLNNHQQEPRPTYGRYQLMLEGYVFYALDTGNGELHRLRNEDGRWTKVTNSIELSEFLGPTTDK